MRFAPIILLAAILIGLALAMMFLTRERPMRVSLPVDCAMGELCTIQNHYDHDPGAGYRDYACGTLSYDGERGTDFRVPDLVAMARGVPVVAVAPGRVLRVRDGTRDVDVRDIGLDAVAGRDAGNGVVIDHGGGWETQYSHLRRGSVAVAPGDVVDRGDVLGMIGMSGRAAFPHLGFEVRYKDRAVDPFVGLGEPEGCGPDAEALWTREALAALAYRPTGLLGAGFAAASPTWPAARRGAYRMDGLPRDAPAIVFWVSIFGGQEGDTVAARLIAPDGSLLAETTDTLERGKAQWFAFVGRKRRGVAWAPGVYRGAYRLVRRAGSAERQVLSVEREVTVR